MWEIQVWFLDWDNPLQFSCVQIPWTGKPGGLQSKGSQRDPTDSFWHFHFHYNRWGHGKQASTKMCSFFQMYLGCGPFSRIISAKASWTELLCVHFLPKVMKWLSLSLFSPLFISCLMHPWKIFKSGKLQKRRGSNSESPWKQPPSRDQGSILG